MTVDFVTMFPYFPGVTVFLLFVASIGNFIAVKYLEVTAGQSKVGSNKVSMTDKWFPRQTTALFGYLIFKVYLGD